MSTRHDDHIYPDPRPGELEHQLDPFCWCVPDVFMTCTNCGGSEHGCYLCETTGQILIDNPTAELLTTLDTNLHIVHHDR
jgi:hypothetical protein